MVAWPLLLLNPDGKKPAACVPGTNTVTRIIETSKEKVFVVTTTRSRRT